MDTRPSAVAGMFYPGDASLLRSTVQSLLAAAPVRGAGWPKALIVPHAGYVYSGPTAAAALSQLAPGRGTIRRVVLLGPVHRVPVRGLALPGAGAFATPLGDVPIDAEGVRALGGLSQVVTSPRAHAMEHSLEVQLPFLQEVLGEFSLLPLAVGDATPQEVADVLEAVWGGPETVVVISSDLSHFLPYATARQVDSATVEAMLACDPHIDHEQACGATPVNGLLLAAPRHGLAPRLVALCNSGDTAGDRDRVVGYASIAFEPAARAPQEAAADEVPQDAGATLLPLARSAIAQALGVEQRAAPPSAAWLRKPGATFVTLTRHGELRGCIGSLEPQRPLLDDVRSNAVSAALHDPRFPSLTREELAQVRVEVSVLTPPEPMAVRTQAEALRELRPHIDGVVLHWGSRRATFLPQVWEQLPRPQDFLAQLKRKAGLPPDFWDDAVRLARYEVRKWSEEALQ